MVQTEEKETYLDPKCSAPSAHGRQVFEKQRTEQATTTPNNAPDFFRLHRGTTNHAHTE